VKKKSPTAFSKSSPFGYSTSVISNNNFSPLDISASLQTALLQKASYDTKTPFTLVSLLFFRDQIALDQPLFFSPDHITLIKLLKLRRSMMPDPKTNSATFILIV
jgi:hypothetical protein